MMPARSEVSGHFGSLHGLEEQLALKEIRQEQQGQCEPWLDESDDDGYDGQCHA